MSLRAVSIGLGLGLLISAFTLFNDAVMKGSWFVGNHLPIVVFGTIVALLLVLNPLLRLVARTSLGSGEVAVIAAISLAACGWPSFGFYRGFVPNVASPDRWSQIEPAWRATGVMTYVPGVTAELAHGHLRDPNAIVDRLISEGEAGGDSIAAQVWRSAQEPEQRTILNRAGDAAESDALVRVLNRVIREASLEAPPSTTLELSAEETRLLKRRAAGTASAEEREALNRRLLVAGFDGAILPAPEGRGALIAGSAAAREASEVLMQGVDPARGPTWKQIDWSVWRPTLVLWVGLGMALSVASLCLALIVHPQWSKRELLIYPLAQFVTELGQHRKNRWLPDIAFNNLFWLGLALAGGLHLINGLGTWFPALEAMKISTRLDFLPLRVLFPTAASVHNSSEVFFPRLYLSVIGFAFFLNANISFSVGIAYFVYMAFATVLISRGVPVQIDYLGTSPVNLMRFGAYAAMTLLIVYFGRHFYARVGLRALGLGRPDPDTPAYAVWAGRLLVLSIVAAAVLLRSAGLDWVLGGIFVMLVLAMFLVLSRIVAETGLFFVQPWWMPVAVLTAVFGIDAIGPTSYILLALACTIIVGDPRTALMPYLNTGLQIVERSPASTSVRLAGALLAMVVVGGVVAGLATMLIMHDYSMLIVDDWSLRKLPSLPFNELSQNLTEMRARGTLATSTANDGLTSLSQVRLSGDLLAWIGAGAALLLICTVARLQLPWWPIHPVLFLIWGTMPSARLGASFLIGWAIKLAVVRWGGGRAYKTILPLMVGLIAGELLAALLWSGVGIVGYLVTGQPPANYRVHP